MNKSKRNNLAKARHLLENAVGIVSDVRDEEQDALDNMPENLQSSDRCVEMEEAIDAMEDAISCIEDASDRLGQI